MQQAYCVYRLFINRNNLTLALPFVFKQKMEKLWPLTPAFCQEHAVPTEQRELPRRMHQRTHRQHCHHPLQQPHVPHWRHWVEQVTQRHLHLDGRHQNHLCGVLQVRQLCPWTHQDWAGKYSRCFYIFIVDFIQSSNGSLHYIWLLVFVCLFFKASFIVVALHGLPHFNSKNYGITIKEMDQPLLTHRPKERSKPGGKVKPLFSISYLNLINAQDTRSVVYF